MRRLTRPREREQGAIAIIVAMLFFFGVMLALGALTVDVGNMNAERRQLQNGADAASLAAAKLCRAGSCPDVTAPDDTALLKLQELVNQNAADHATDIARLDSTKPALCGYAPLASPALLDCADSSLPDMSNLGDCPPRTDLPDGTNYVRVYTTTKMDDGSPLLPFAFGQAIVGGSGTTQQTCAAAAWAPGYPPDEVVAVTYSACAWAAATDSGKSFPPQPPYSPLPNLTPLGQVPDLVPTASVVKVLLQGTTNTTTDSSTCPRTTSGSYTAGNFGWLDVKSGTSCTADMNSDTQIMGGSTGGSISSSCETYLTTKIGHMIYMPVFKSKSETGTGTNAQYTLDGVFAFFLAGYQAPGAYGNNIATPAYDATLGVHPTTHCIPNGVDSDGGCLWGWFLDPELNGGSFGEGGGKGPTILAPIG